jgi:hypothetical protein
MKKRPKVSRTRAYVHVAMTFGFASRAERRPLRSMWHPIVSSSVVENTFLNAKTPSQIIAVCFSSGTPPGPSGRNFIQIIIWISLCSKWHITRPSGRNFIQIIIWISLCSVTASPCQFERLSCQFERSREHVRMYTSQWHLASHLERNAARYSRSDKQSLSVRA